MSNNADPHAGYNWRESLGTHKRQRPKKSNTSCLVCRMYSKLCDRKSSTTCENCWTGGFMCVGFEEMDTLNHDLESSLSAIHTDEPATERRLSGDMDSAELNTSTMGEPGVSGSVITEDMIDSFKNHKVYKKDSTVSIEVLWKDRSITFEDEYHLHDQVPNLLFDYWSKLGGRDDATGLKTYHVFKVLEHKDEYFENKLRTLYKVEWVGFPPRETTWEPAYKIKRNARVAMKTYVSKLGLQACLNAGAKKSSKSN